MIPELRKLIDSARQQADATEAEERERVVKTTMDRANQIIALESARQKRAWADFAEAGAKTSA